MSEESTLAPARDPAAPLSALGLAAHTLDARAALAEEGDPVLAAFAAWLAAPPAPPQTVGAPVPRADRAIAVASKRRGAARRYHDVAVLGFAVGLPEVGAEARAAWADGLAWLRGRRFFVANQPLGFEADGLALLGVAAGVAIGVAATGAAAGAEDGRASRTEDAAAWLVELLRRAIASAPEAGEWEASLLRAALLLVTPSSATPSNAAVATAGEAGRSGADAPTLIASLAPDLAAALAARGYLALTAAGELAALQRIVSPDVAQVAPERALAQRAALRWLMRQGATALPRRATVDDVVALLAAVPHALKRWPWEHKARTARAGVVPQRWDIQNEYHVQSLLWTILAPIFPDLVDEEYLRSIGHVHPRVDLAIPSLGLIIEVKFLREGIQSAFTGIINEVSADTGLYLSKPSEFTAIVAFVWDDARATNHHAELLRGLRDLRGVTDAVVVPRPGGWEPRA